MTEEQANQLNFLYNNIENIISKINVNVANCKIVLLGSGTSFNISDIVGSENIGQYSINDFIVVPDIKFPLSYDINQANSQQVRANSTISAPYVHNLSYDNTNGNVSVTTMTISHVYRYWASNGASATYSNNWTINPKIYLLQKSNL